MTTLERQIFLADRRQFVGASDTPALLGLSRWDTPLGVYLSKVEPDLIAGDMTDEQRWGMLMEPVLHEEYQRVYGVGLTAPASERHPDYPFIGASIDRLTDDGDIVELKTASQYTADQWGEPDTDEAPESYLLQCQQQMAVHGGDRAYIFVAFWAEFRRYVVPRNDDIIRRILDVDRQFWEQHVVPRIPPEPDFAHGSTVELLDRLHRPTPGRTITLTADQLAVALQYEALGVQGREVEGARHQAKARLIDALGTAEYGLLADGRRVRRQMQTRKSYVVAEATFPTIRFLNPPKTRN